MAWDPTKDILRNNKGEPVPQVWDDVAQTFVVYEGVAKLTTGSAVIGKAQVRNAANNADIDPLAEATFTGRVGEVQASPTANTVLARLKDIKDGVPLTGSTVPSAVTMQNAAAANGNGTNLNVSGMGTAVLTVSGTFNATVNFEASNDGGTSWYPHLATKLGDGAIAATTPTTGQYRLNVAGVDLVRARISGYVSGNVTVVGKTSAIVAPSKAITLTGAKVDEILKNQQFLIKQSVPRDIFGATWDKGSIPTLTRTGSAAGKVANAGVGIASVTNDFDSLPIWGEFEEVVDELGNVFIRIPKVYLRKLNDTSFRGFYASRHQHPGFYLPWCFYDFTSGRELPHIDYSKYKASLESGTNKLESKPDKYPLVNDTIVNFRTFARNNNTGGLLGYQQLDIHTYDVLRTLMLIEFATLNMQTVMQGYTTGRHTADDKAVAATDPAGNVIVVSNATGALYRVGQAISCGTSLSGIQRFYGRTITNIQADTPAAGQTTITFDGAAVVLAVNDILYNTGWRNGFSRGTIAASSGCIVANDGKYPWSYRGIESPFGDVWQFVDGVNINEMQAWVAANAADYASNVFASPYRQLGYVNHTADGWTTAMGFDPANPFAEFPTAVGGSGNTFYSDYYYPAAGQRVALVGGGWFDGASAGASSWPLSLASSTAYVNVGGRLLKKAL